MTNMKKNPMNRSMADHFYFHVNVNFLSMGWFVASLAPKNT